MKQTVKIILKIAAVLLATLVLAGCYNPVTGKYLYTGSLEINNQFETNTTITRVQIYEKDDGTGKPDINSKKILDQTISISKGGSAVLTDIPAGTWYAYISSGTPIIAKNMVLIIYKTTTKVKVDQFGLNPLLN